MAKNPKGNGHEETGSSRLSEYIASGVLVPPRSLCKLCQLRDRRKDVYRDVLQLYVSKWGRKAICDYLEYLGITSITGSIVENHFVRGKHHSTDEIPTMLPNSLHAQLDAIPTS